MSPSLAEALEDSWSSLLNRTSSLLGVACRAPLHPCLCPSGPHTSSTDFTGSHSPPPAAPCSGPALPLDLTPLSPPWNSHSLPLVIGDIPPVLQRSGQSHFFMQPLPCRPTVFHALLPTQASLCPRAPCSSLHSSTAHRVSPAPNAAWESEGHRTAGNGRALWKEWSMRAPPQGILTPHCFFKTPCQPDETTLWLFEPRASSRRLRSPSGLLCFCASSVLT